VLEHTARMGAVLLLAWLAWAPDTALAAARPPLAAPGVVSPALQIPSVAPRGRTRRRLEDVGVAAAGTLAVAALKPGIRDALAREARFGNVMRNFAHPVEQVCIGTRRDSDPFWVNGIAHPGLFALEALYLKRRGYTDAGAFAFTQTHSLLWEFAVEGSAIEPSGKDLVADAAGAALAIWVLRPTAQRSARRLAAGHGHWWDHALRWLDPVSALAPRRNNPAVAVSPLTGRRAAGVQLSVAF